jgi:hypothetical protein
MINNRSFDKLPTLKKSGGDINNSALKALENRLTSKVDGMFAKLKEMVEKNDRKIQIYMEGNRSKSPRIP